MDIHTPSKQINGIFWPTIYITKFVLVLSVCSFFFCNLLDLCCVFWYFPVFAHEKAGSVKENGWFIAFRQTVGFVSLSSLLLWCWHFWTLDIWLYYYFWSLYLFPWLVTRFGSSHMSPWNGKLQCFWNDSRMKHSPTLSNVEILLYNSLIDRGSLVV